MPNRLNAQASTQTIARADSGAAPSSGGGARLDNARPSPTGSALASPSALCVFGVAVAVASLCCSSARKRCASARSAPTTARRRGRRRRMQAALAKNVALSAIQVADADVPAAARAALERGSPAKTARWMTSAAGAGRRTRPDRASERRARRLRGRPERRRVASPARWRTARRWPRTCRLRRTRSLARSVVPSTTAWAHHTPMNAHMHAAGGPRGNLRCWWPFLIGCCLFPRSAAPTQTPS